MSAHVCHSSIHDLSDGTEYELSIGNEMDKDISNSRVIVSRTQIDYLVEL